MNSEAMKPGTRNESDFWLPGFRMNRRRNFSWFPGLLLQFFLRIFFPMTQPEKENHGGSEHHCHGEAPDAAGEIPRVHLDIAERPWAEIAAEVSN